MKRIVCFLLVFFMFNTSSVYANTDMYARCMRVTEVYGSEDPEVELVFVVDCNGYEYSFYSDKGDWSIKDCAVCIMFGNGTKTVEDDIILSADYDRPDLLGF